MAHSGIRQDTDDCRTRRDGACSWEGQRQRSLLPRARLNPRGVISLGPSLQPSKITKNFFMFGALQYIEMFSPAPLRVTKFCVVATHIMGDPTSPWDAEKNNMEIAFATYQRHNCADEECGENP